ncbi:unknown protein [Seminavis robusta]|uniref:Uncharacterized protein n=1 Tax=Seminavis robusta TaxID=568900 RepID=A0A9N8HSL5_9STRA|nr:unknown protein [Seminavis robusta]|eukprot:Sro1537_g280730.1 n/a (197) ;mRNA; r:26740-27330
MQGIQSFSEDTATWEQVDDRVKCLWPSVELAAQSDLTGLRCIRPLPAYHWNKNIPVQSRTKIFGNASPNPPNSKLYKHGLSTHEQHLALAPTTHGKFLFNTEGVLYVGSHNFSRAAWGLGDAMPKNVELGVVMVSSKFDRIQAWVERLPCRLVPPSNTAPQCYQPFCGLNYQGFLDKHALSQQRKEQQNGHQDCWD